VNLSCFLSHKGSTLTYFLIHHPMQRLSSLLLTALVGGIASSASAVDFAKQIFPILNNKCAKCHSEKKGETKGDFAIDNKANLKGIVIAGNAIASELVTIITAPDDDDDVMPPKGKGTKVSAAEVKLIKDWIQEGANFEAGGAKPAAPTAGPAAAGGAMAWTNTAGKALQAEFDRMEGDAVVLKAADGQYYKVPLTSLSPASQAQAKKAAGQ
jgi:hypothetical protein